MTTYRHTIELDDSEAIALRAALDSLQEECNLHIANKQAAPWTAYLRSIASLQTNLSNGAQQASGNTFGPVLATDRQPQSELFTARITDRGELPWLEIRALASIGAGLVMRHLGDPKAIKKLGRLAVPFDAPYHNATAKAMAGLLEDAAGGPYDPTEQDWIDLAKLAGLKLEVLAHLFSEDGL